jgi:hypothetical protein
MHDFHLANEIVKIAGEEAGKSGLLKIEKILIELGDIIEHRESISPENSPGHELVLPGIRKNPSPYPCGKAD